MMKKCYHDTPITVAGDEKAISFHCPDCDECFTLEANKLDKDWHIRQLGLIISMRRAEMAELEAKLTRTQAALECAKGQRDEYCSVWRLKEYRQLVDDDAEIQAILDGKNGEEE